MTNQQKSNNQFATELEAMRQRVAELEAQVANMHAKEDIPAEAFTGYSFDLLHRLIQELPTGVQMFDTNGICTSVNKAQMEIFGLSSSTQVVGHFNLFTDIMAEKVGTQAAGQKALSGQVVHLPEVHFDFKDADPQFATNKGHRLLSVTFFPVKNESGEVIHLVVLNEDITDRKATERAIRLTEEKYRTLVEQLPVIIYTFEFGAKKNRITYISPQIEALLGYTPEEWLSKPDLWINRIHPDDREDVLAAVRQSEEEHKSINLEYRILARDGRILWFKNQTAAFGENGSLRYLHGVLLDITKQKQLEEQLIHAQRLEAVGQMAGGISHNFNNVLTALIGHTELAMDALPDDHPVQVDLEGIQKGAKRAADLTQQLLAFTRHQDIRPQLLNLNTIITDQKNMLQQLLTPSIQLSIQLSPDLRPVKIDSGQMKQVLINLVVNATDAMPNGGKLTLQTTNVTFDETHADISSQLPAGDYVVLNIIDTGTGIPADVQPHIFEPFFTTKDVGQGTGLGLSTCFGIIKQNRGHIVFETREKQGTTFKIYLPRSQETLAQTIPVQPGKGIPRGSETLLLVEDNTIVRTMSARALNQQGYVVLEAKNGPDALQIIKDQPDTPLQLLITDIMMPEMSGDILANKMETLYPGLKVLLISGHTDRTLSKSGLIEKNYAVLSKPFTPDKLAQKVRRVLDGKDE